MVRKFVLMFVSTCLRDVFIFLDGPTVLPDRALIIGLPLVSFLEVELPQRGNLRQSSFLKRFCFYSDKVSSKKASFPIC